MKSTRDCIRSLEEWFHKNLTGEQYEALARRVAHIPADPLFEVCQQIIDENAPTPARFPTVQRLLEGWRMWLQEHPEFRAAAATYDRDEDLDFPIEHMNSAFNLLLQKGKGPFMAFCEKVRMPRADRDRVLTKARMVSARGNKAIPDVSKGIDATDDGGPIFVSEAYRTDGPSNATIVFVPEPFAENRARAKRDPAYLDSLRNHKPVIPEAKPKEMPADQYAELLIKREAARRLAAKMKADEVVI